MVLFSLNDFIRTARDPKAIIQIWRTNKRVYHGNIDSIDAWMIKDERSCYYVIDHDIDNGEYIVRIGYGL
jgi:hypothetical protein